ncbi:sensor histidine kinase [Pseudoclavibacter sp. RFBA6]|uniref:sensor histidine kinase n=1 Tax=Pseudoclavibacter sp. RFBA6 TaxID=2080573 RepID=UPI002699C4A9|nr:sensor histidine kinase [Pseudoclavibacter sp. RFBA6]
MRFATRVLLLQLAMVVTVVVLCSAAFLVLAVQQLRAESESTALNIARAVAEDPDVRSLVAEFSADPGTPTELALRDGPLQERAVAVAGRTDALFVVLTDDHGIRLAHPDQDLLGQVVSTPFEAVIGGDEVVEWEVGTLGESARAKVPIYAPDAASVVGEVSVGFERASVFDDLPALLATAAGIGVMAVLVALLATLMLRRRFERLTLGLQPEELVALVQNQAAVLDGVGDGVLALDPSGVVRVCNAEAARMLRLRDAVGRTLTELGLPAGVIDAVAAAGTLTTVLLDDQVLYLDRRSVKHEGRLLGDVLIIRDRTDVVALSERLETVRAMTGALRVQRHEFGNRMHVVAGLIDAMRVDDARAFLTDLIGRGAVDEVVDGIELVTDSFLRAFLNAKGLEASERGVALRIADDTLLVGDLDLVEEAATILGNLIDNAIAAAAGGGEPRWVEVVALDDGDELVVTVADSGAGIQDGIDVFSRKPGDETRDTVHGHGIGLPLSRELARRAGGDLWVIDVGGAGGAGAVLGARLPGVMRTNKDGDQAR